MQTVFRPGSIGRRTRGDRRKGLLDHLRQARRARLAVAAVAASFAARAEIVLSAEWNLDANGSWNLDAHWVNPATFPTGAGSVADFSKLNISGNRTVTLGQDMSVGTMTVGDMDSTHTHSFAAGNALTFNNSGSVSTLTSLGNTATSTISASIRLGSNVTLDINVDGTGHLACNANELFIDPEKTDPAQIPQRIATL